MCLVCQRYSKETMWLDRQNKKECCIGEFAGDQSDIPDTILKTVRRGQLWKYGKQQGGC